MANVLGILYLCFYIVVVIGIAMGMTWLVVRVSPKPKDQKPADDGAADAG